MYESYLKIVYALQTLDSIMYINFFVIPIHITLKVPQLWYLEERPTLRSVPPAAKLMADLGIR
jgi:hypothetical protein